MIRRIALAASLLLAATVVAVVPVATPASADQGVVVSPHPDQRHPRVLNGRVYAVAAHGDLVAVGGTFTSVRNGAAGSPDQTRQWIFLYDKSTGSIVESFDPVLGGPAPDTSGLTGDDKPGVEAIQWAPDGQSLYVGGWFTSVNGRSRQRIVRLDLDGSVHPGFNASVNNAVKDMVLVGGRLIVGGKFGTANGQPVSRLVSLDPTTGATQTDFNLPATESRDQYAPFVQELAASPDGHWLALSGSFQRIGTVARNQVALIDLTGTPSVANWSTDDYAEDCAAVYDDTWVHGIDISPDSSYVVFSTTGAYKSSSSLCDSVARFELPPTASGDGLHPTWRTLSGGDTFWATEITTAAVYVGGHQRWVNNPRPSPGGDNDGPGSVARPGIVALDPASGVPLSWNPGRDRGRGAEAIEATDDYLIVGSDTDLFDGQVRQRLAALPVAGGTVNPQPTPVDLPVTLTWAVGSGLRSAPFDGATVGPVSTTPGSTGTSWSGFRDGFVQDGRLHYFGPGQAFWSRPFSSSGIGDATNLSTSVGYVDTNYDLTPYDQPYGVAETMVAAYQDGQIYYVKSGDDRLWHRGYSLESGIIDGGEAVASGRSFANARALEFIGDWLYAAWSDGGLYRFYAPGGRVDVDSRQLVDAGNGIDWSQVHGLVATPAAGSAVQPTAPSYACDASTPWRAGYWSNQTLTGAPDVTRCEASVDYSWGSGSPSGTGVPSNNFSARWTRSVTVTGGRALRATAASDDGVRVYVDGVRILDSWVDSSGDTRVGTSGALSAGSHEVRVDYYENAGDAQIHVGISEVDAPAPPVAPDNLPGDTAVMSPGNGQAVTASGSSTSVPVTGTATDDRGVTAVRVGIYDRNAATDKWLQTNGTWGPTYAYRQATLASPGATSTTWSLPGVALPVGAYAIDAVAVDAAGNVDPTSAFRSFTVTSTVADTTAPVPTVSAPASKSTVTSSSFTATGTVADDVSAAQVRVGVYDRSAARWLQADGSWGSSYAFRSATLASPGASSTAWSLPLTLPQGSYALDVRARDAAGNLTASSVWNPFEVRTTAPDTTAPTSTVTSPAKNAVVPSTPVLVQGTATDDRSLGTQRVAIYNRVDPTDKWLQADGSWGPTYAFRLATLASPGATSSTWSISIPLPDGLYSAEVRAVDAAGNVGPSAPYAPFQVGSDTTAPKATVTGSTSTTTLRGTASDDSSVLVVKAKVRRTLADGRTRFLQQNGKWGRTAVFVRTDLATAGKRSTRWRLKLQEAPGRYRVAVLAVDASRNSPRTPSVKRFVVR